MDTPEQSPYISYDTETEENLTNKSFIYGIAIIVVIFLAIILYLTRNISAFTNSRSKFIKK